MAETNRRGDGLEKVTPSKLAILVSMLDFWGVPFSIFWHQLYRLKVFFTGSNSFQIRGEGSRVKFDLL